MTEFEDYVERYPEDVMLPAAYLSSISRLGMQYVRERPHPFDDEERPTINR